MLCHVSSWPPCAGFISCTSFVHMDGLRPFFPRRLPDDASGGRPSRRFTASTGNRPQPRASRAALRAWRRSSAASAAPVLLVERRKRLQRPQMARMAQRVLPPPCIDRQHCQARHARRHGPAPCARPIRRRQRRARRRPTAPAAHRDPVLHTIRARRTPQRLLPCGPSSPASSASDAGPPASQARRSRAACRCCDCSTQDSAPTPLSARQGAPLVPEAPRSRPPGAQPAFQPPGYRPRQRLSLRCAAAHLQLHPCSKHTVNHQTIENILGSHVLSCSVMLRMRMAHIPWSFRVWSRPSRPGFRGLRPVGPASRLRQGRFVAPAPPPARLCNGTLCRPRHARRRGPAPLRGPTGRQPGRADRRQPLPAPAGPPLGRPNAPRRQTRRRHTRPEQHRQRLRQTPLRQELRRPRKPRTALRRSRHPGRERRRPRHAPATPAAPAAHRNMLRRTAQRLALATRLAARLLPQAPGPTRRRRLLQTVARRRLFNPKRRSNAAMRSTRRAACSRSTAFSVSRRAIRSSELSEPDPAKDPCCDPVMLMDRFPHVPTPAPTPAQNTHPGRSRNVMVLMRNIHMPHPVRAYGWPPPVLSPPPACEGAPGRRMLRGRVRPPFLPLPPQRCRLLHAAEPFSARNVRARARAWPCALRGGAVRAPDCARAREANAGRTSPLRSRGPCFSRRRERRNGAAPRTPPPSTARMVARISRNQPAIKIIFRFCEPLAAAPPCAGSLPVPYWRSRSRERAGWTGGLRARRRWLRARGR